MAKNTHIYWLPGYPLGLVRHFQKTAKAMCGRTVTPDLVKSDGLSEGSVDCPGCREAAIEHAQIIQRMVDAYPDRVGIDARLQLESLRKLAAVTRLPA